MCLTRSKKLTHWLLDCDFKHDFQKQFGDWCHEYFQQNCPQGNAMGAHCWIFNTLRPRQNGCHFPHNIVKWIFLNENLWIFLKILQKFVPKVQINNIPGLVQIMAWCWPSDKPLSEPMMVSLLTLICITRPQWVNNTPGCGLVLSGRKPLPGTVNALQLYDITKPQWVNTCTTSSLMFS